MKTNTNNIYSKMLDHFNSETDKNLTFKMNNNIGDDYGITRGDANNSSNYTITINQNSIEENGSNLSRYVTLCHELMHAYMFDTLEDLGLITFDANGEPKLNILNATCEDNDVFLNTLTIKDRFVALICGMSNAGTLTNNQWSHELFNNNVFDIEDYRQALENLIVDDYDWDSEGTTFASNAATLFGDNWNQEVAKAVSWIGLEETSGRGAYVDSYIPNLQQWIFVTQIRTMISSTNNNCP